MMNQQEAPLSIRDRQRHIDAVIERLKEDANESLYIVNALLWKLNVPDLKSAEAIVAEYTAHMEKVLAEKKAKAGTETVIENFIPVAKNVTPDTAAESK